VTNNLPKLEWMVCTNPDCKSFMRWDDDDQKYTCNACGNEVEGLSREAEWFLC